MTNSTEFSRIMCIRVDTYNYYETVGTMGTRDTEEAGRGGAEENREGTEEG